MTNPDYVGIGNSMLFTRLGRTQRQVEELNELTGHSFYFVLKGGSTSAMWYLTLKNIVAASGIHPKMVFFFFRDTELTSPLANTNGKHEAYLNSLRGLTEPEVDLLLLPPTRDGLVSGTVDHMSKWLSGPEGLYDFSLRPGKVQRRLTNLALKMGGGRLLKDGDRRVLTERFGVERLRPDVPAEMVSQITGNDEAFDPYMSLSNNYYGDVEAGSFLPPIMEVAREHGIKLLFFRVKKRPEAEGGTVTAEPEPMRGYVHHLQQWIEERGGLFYDETYDPAIRLDAYNDGDHIGLEHMDWYRRYFWSRMASVFP